MKKDALKREYFVGKVTYCMKIPSIFEEGENTSENVT